MPDPDNTVRLRLDLGYDGRDFAGWARQPGLRTVQGELETRITQILRLDQPARLTAAGRTDAGVHARGQVCHLDVPPVTTNRGQVMVSADALRRLLPGALPADIAIHAVSVAPDGFDARFAASERRYVYRLVDDPFALDPLERHREVAVRPGLDLALMAEAASTLLGRHDFAAFCKPRPDATTIRTLRRLEPLRPSPGRLELWVAADAFCHSMVRSLTGALVAVGQHQRPADWLTGLLDRPGRASDVRVMPPQGLTLEEVVYPPVAEMAARISAARQRQDCCGDQRYQ